MKAITIVLAFALYGIGQLAHADLACLESDSSRGVFDCKTTRHDAYWYEWSAAPEGLLNPELPQMWPGIGEGWRATAYCANRTDPDSARLDGSVSVSYPGFTYYENQDGGVIAIVPLDSTPISCRSPAYNDSPVMFADTGGDYGDYWYEPDFGYEWFLEDFYNLLYGNYNYQYGW